MRFFVILPDKTLFPQEFSSISDARNYSNDITGSQVISERQLSILQNQKLPNKSFIHRPFIGNNPLEIILVGKPSIVKNGPLRYLPVITTLYKPPVLYKKIEVID